MDGEPIGWGRRLRDAAIVASIGFVAALVLTEISVRVLGLAAEKHEPLAARAPLDPALRGLPELVTTRDLRRRNVRGVHYGVLHRTNSEGVRGPQYSREPAPGTYRIVIVGDSFAMGHHVDESDAYAAVLERSLNAQASDVRFEVINAGLSGLSIAGIERRVRLVALPYHPHLIVYGLMLNDIENPSYRANSPEERAAFRVEQLRFADSPLHVLRLVWPGWISLRSSIAPMPGSNEYALERGYFRTPRAWKPMVTRLERMAGWAADRGICFHVFIQEMEHQLEFWHPNRRIADRIEAAALGMGLTVSNSLWYFWGRNLNELRISSTDLHPNEEGHRLLARALEEGLRELPERCGFPLTAGP